MQKSKGVFTAAENKQFIEPYLEILDRNQEDMYTRLMEFVTMHEDLIEDENKRTVFSGDEHKINALHEIYLKADPHSPEKYAYIAKLNDQMFGRMMNEINSYDYLDNEKYKRIEKMLEIMKETFGFEQETP